MSIQTTPEANQAAGVIPAAPWRVKALSVLPDYRLAVTFMDGASGIVDFSAVLTAKECGIFEALKDKACFDQARLDLGVVTWPNGADIDPGWMHEQIKANKSWSPFDLMDFIGTIEAALGQTAKKNFLPMQDGDVQATYADIDELVRDTGCKPATTLEYGIGKWVDWYRGYKKPA